MKHNFLRKKSLNNNLVDCIFVAAKIAFRKLVFNRTESVFVHIHLKITVAHIVCFIIVSIVKQSKTKTKNSFISYLQNIYPNDPQIWTPPLATFKCLQG